MTTHDDATGRIHFYTYRGFEIRQYWQEDGESTVATGYDAYAFGHPLSPVMGSLPKIEHWVDRYLAPTPPPIKR